MPTVKVISYIQSQQFMHSFSALKWSHRLPLELWCNLFSALLGVVIQIDSNVISKTFVHTKVICI